MAEQTMTKREREMAAIAAKKKAADDKAHGNMMLSMTARKGEVGEVKRFLSEGADVDTLNACGFSTSQFTWNRISNSPLATPWHYSLPSAIVLYPPPPVDPGRLFVCLFCCCEVTRRSGRIDHVSPSLPRRQHDTLEQGSDARRQGLNRRATKRVGAGYEDAVSSVTHPSRHQHAPRFVSSQIRAGFVIIVNDFGVA